MPVEQGLPWHPVATELAGQATPCLPCARSAIRSILVPCSRYSGCLSCLAVPLLLVCCARPCPSWCGSHVLCVAPPPVCWRSWVPLSHTPSCPTRLPPARGFHISVRRGLSRAQLAGHGPVATPVAGTSRRAGHSPRPCGVLGHLVEEGPQMVRLQCPHLALAAPAPQLSSPSVQSANVRRSLSSRSVQQFIPRPCVRSLHSLPGLYRVMRASRSKVTPFPWCYCSWPHSATLGRALLGP